MYIAQLISLLPLLVLGIVLDRRRPVPALHVSDQEKQQQQQQHQQQQQQFIKIDNELKVMTYNVQCCLSTSSVYSPSLTCSIILKHSPDIVLLQELTNKGMTNSWIGTTSHSATETDEPVNSVNQIELLVEILKKNGLKYTGHYHGPHSLSESPPDRSGTYGIGILILEKHKIVKHDTLTYTRIPTREIRGALSVSVEIDSKIVKFVCTHLQHDPTGHEQYRQTLELIDFAGDGEVVIGGDLNCFSGKSSSAVRTLKDKFGDGNVEGLTFPHKWLDLKLDYLFCGGEIKRVREDRILEGEWSDHYPVLAVVGYEK
ncbi:hypothetical protein TL16_g00923 [Triparma laevis f. inornata]|uniref:Endonuclease/exonuclease/phosphatase domain-containing protein n=1 Tax=Triparma laevis f. inornata TaxID=1714386 RepID=A0A9W6ZB84_9STRA|nr:hypothetical protein TL16_g00923 [Triparma laevis f. inornata]